MTQVGGGESKKKKGNGPPSQKKHLKDGILEEINRFVKDGNVD